MTMPNEKIMISMAGIFLTRAMGLKYCHIDKVLSVDLETNSYIVTAYAVHKDGNSETVCVKLFWHRNQGRYMCYKYQYV